MKTPLGSSDGASAPAISVVVLAYQARTRIDPALRSLVDQDLDEPYEIIVVDSGSDGCANHVGAAYPGVRIVRSPVRLNPAQARNRGLRAAEGRYVAFLPDDAIADRDWLRRRLEKHRAGFEAVAGAITNGTPFHPIGSAGYYLEYSALIPSARVLEAQAIPHCLSYGQSVFRRVGDFPEDVETGEDSVFNRRCLDAGVSVGFEAAARYAHRNPKRLRAYLAHQHRHGRGLVQCVQRHAFPSIVASPAEPAPLALYRTFVLYPARRWSKALARIARGCPLSLPWYLALSPLVCAGLWATAAGAWRERREHVRAT